WSSDVCSSDLEEPRTGDVDGFDAVTLTQPDGEELGQRTRIRAGLLGQLHGDVGGVVAVIAVARALDDDGGGHAVGQGDVAGLDSRREDVAHGGGQLLGGHRASVATTCSPS